MRVEWLRPGKLLGKVWKIVYMWSTTKKTKQLAAHTIGGQNPEITKKRHQSIRTCFSISTGACLCPSACLLMVLTTPFHQAECHRVMARKGPQMGTIDGRVTHLMSKEK